MHDLTDGEYRALSYVGRVMIAYAKGPYWRDKGKYLESLKSKGLLKQDADDTITLTETGKKAIGQ
jgi:predicted transcriptional regulator